MFHAPTTQIIRENQDKSMFHVKHWGLSNLVIMAWQAGVKHINRKKIVEWFFYLFLISIPLQTRIIYATDQAYVSWYFNYHLAIILYLSDLIFLVCFTLWFTWNIPHLNKNRENTYIFIFLLLVLGLIGLFHVKQFNLGWYSWIKWLELFLVFIFIARFTSNIRARVLNLLFIVGVLEAMLGILQFHVQHDLGLGWLGEYIAPLGTPGLSTISIGTDKVIRAYGTMPHPNVLAGFLVFPLLLGFYYVSSAFSKLSADKQDYVSRGTFTAIIVSSVGIVLILWGIAVTFSRSAWLGAGIGILLWLIYLLFQKSWKNLGLSLVLVIVSCGTLFFSYKPYVLARGNLNLEQSNVAISDRKFFNSLALEEFKQKPWFGVGIGNYIPELVAKKNLEPWQYQPPHNAFLMLLVEWGIVGLGIFLFFIGHIFYLNKKNFKEPLFVLLSISLIAIVIISFFDHYFVTIQQGRLILFTLLGLLASLQNLKDYVVS